MKLRQNWEIFKLRMFKRWAKFSRIFSMCGRSEFLEKSVNKKIFSKSGTETIFKKINFLLELHQSRLGRLSRWRTVFVRRNPSCLVQMKQNNFRFLTVYNKGSRSKHHWSNGGWETRPLDKTAFVSTNSSDIEVSILLSKSELIFEMRLFRCGSCVSMLVFLSYQNSSTNNFTFWVFFWKNFARTSIWQNSSKGGQIVSPG